MNSKKRERQHDLEEFLVSKHKSFTRFDPLYPDDAEFLAESLLSAEGIAALGLPERIVHQIMEYWRLEDEEYEKERAERAKLRAKRDAEIQIIKDKYAKFGVTDEED